MNFLSRHSSKCLILLLLLGLALSSFGQAPAYIPYQAIARDNAGLAKSNTAIQVEFRIYNNMLGNTPSYRESHSLSTNDFGYFNLRIGAGTVQNGSFNSILWQTGDVSYEVWIDMGAGLSQLGGRTGFLSVPYALYAANAAPAATLNINAPNTISNPSSGIYNIQIPSPSLTINNNSLSISNGNEVVLPGNYSAGNGIAINGTVISNTQPNQTVSVSGNAVSGSYPSYSISNQSLSISGNVVSLSGANSINLPIITPTLSAIGTASISGTYPNQTINVPAQNLSVNANSLVLSGGGGTVNLPQTTTLTQSVNISVTGTAPDYTISSVTPTLNVTGNAGLSGTYPLQTLNVPTQVLSVAGNNLSLSNGGGSVNLPQTTITQGTNVIVSGTAPNYTVAAVTPTLNVTGNAGLSGTYPVQTLNVPAQALSIAGNNLSLSNGGGSVTLPISTTTLIQGSNISLSGSAPAYTVNAVTPTLTGIGNATVTGSYPNQNIDVPPQLLSVTGGTFLGQSLTLSNGGGSVNIGDYMWSTTGNQNTNPVNNYIGTTDAADLSIRTAGVERMRISSSGSVVIGSGIPTALFDVNYGTVKLGAGSDPFSTINHGTVQVSGFTANAGVNNLGSFNLPFIQPGDVLIVTLNSAGGTGNSFVSLSNAWISAAGVVSFYIYSSNLLLPLNVNLNFSYIVIRS